MTSLKILLLLLAINFAFLFVFSELNVNYQFLEKEFYPNSYATLAITLQNPTKDEIKNINLIFETEDKNIEIIPNDFSLEKLSSFSQFSQNFLIKIYEQAKTSNIRLYVSYFIGSERKSYYLNIPIKIVRFPIILIRNINYSQEFLEPGKSMTVTIELYNNGYSSAKDLKLKLIVPFGFSSQKDENFVKEIRVGETAKISFVLYSNPQVDLGYYNIPILLSYFNEDFSKVFNETKSFSIKVFGKPQLNVFVESATDNYLTIKIANNGISKVKNIIVKFFEKQFFIEELLPGDFDTIEIEKRNILHLNITYLDYLNNLHQEEKTIYLNELITNISNVTLPRKYPLDIRRQSSQSSIQISIILTILIVISIILFFVFIFKKLKRKKK